MIGVMNMNFSHIMQQFLTLKPSPIQVPKNKKFKKKKKWFWCLTSCFWSAYVCLVET